MADTKRRIKNEEIKKETTEPEAVSQSTAMQERMESVSRKILITARNELYMKMRFLDVALSCMPFIPDTGADGMGTDGLYLYYDPQYLGGLFREDRVMVNRIYLHPVMQLPPAQFRQPRLPAIPSPRFCRLPKTGVSAFRRKAKFLSVMHLSMSFSNITPTMHKRRIKKSFISLLTAAMKTEIHRLS